MFNLPEYTGESKLDNVASDAQEFRKLAEHILQLVNGDFVKSSGNKHVLCFIASGLIDAIENMQTYIANEVEKN